MTESRFGVDTTNNMPAQLCDPKREENVNRNLGLFRSPPLGFQSPALRHTSDSRHEGAGMQRAHFERNFADIGEHMYWKRFSLTPPRDPACNRRIMQRKWTLYIIHGISRTKRYTPKHHPSRVARRIAFSTLRLRNAGPRPRQIGPRERSTAKSVDVWEKKIQRSIDLSTTHI